MTNQILSIIRGYVPDDRHHLIHPDAGLSETGMNDLDRWFSLPTKLEEEFGLEQFTDAQIASWSCVSDVVQAVRSRLTVGVV